MTDKRPNIDSLGNKELDKAEKDFKKYDESIKEMTLERMNAAPLADVEPQTKMSQKDIEKSKEIYLKPKRQISSREKFNEKYRDQYNFSCEMVRFVGENREIRGENIELWTKPYAGMPAQEWVVPVNTPVWGPRHLAERLSKCQYHRFTMQQTTGTGGDNQGNQYYGAMAVDTIINRIDAMPVSNSKSIFMGAQSF